MQLIINETITQQFGVDAENGKATKLSLSRYAKRAAQDSEQLSTREAPLVHKVAQVAQIVHPEQFNPKGQDPATVAVNIAILNA